MGVCCSSIPGFGSSIPEPPFSDPRDALRFGVFRHVRASTLPASWTRDTPLDKWEGITVDRERPGDVLEVDVVGRDLVGRIDARHFPWSTKKIRIGTNKLRGAIDWSALPPRLEVWNCADNELTGTIAFERFPQSIKEIRCDNNRFTAATGLKTLLMTHLETLWLADNIVVAPISELQLPRTAVDCNVRKNFLYGVADLSALPPRLRFLDLRWNSLWGFSPRSHSDMAHVPKDFQVEEAVALDGDSNDHKLVLEWLEEAAQLGFGFGDEAEELTARTKRTLLTWAEHRRFDALRWLLRNFAPRVCGFDTADAARDERTGRTGRTALTAAVERGDRVLCAELLRTCHADVDGVDGRGERPLAVACARSEIEVARVLMQAGATPATDEERAFVESLAE